MIVANTAQIQGYEITENLGIVTGNVVQSKHVGRDIMAGLKTLVGGEIAGYTEMLTEAREKAQNRMIQEAQSKGAGAIINVRYTTSAITDGMCELLAYGTAVKISTNVPPLPQ
ncbi:MAG: heavy metal-binding domain-containing protein [Verrucomicrobiota bacterium]